MGAFSVDTSSQYARLVGCLESETAFSTAENLRPSTRVGGTTRGKRKAAEIKGIVDDIGATEWMSRGLGTGRGMEGFVAVVVGKGGVLILVIILSSLQLVLYPLVQK